MRIVLDTNVMISSLLFGGNSRKVYDYCIENSDVFTSDFLLAELEEKLSEKFSLDKKLMQQIIQSIESIFIIANPTTPLPKICGDIDDNRVLQICESVNADFLVTGNKDLFELIKFKKTRIFLLQYLLSQSCPDYKIMIRSVS